MSRKTTARVTRHLVLASLGMLAACVAPNPDFNPSAPSRGTSGGSSGPSVESSGEGGASESTAADTAGQSQGPSESSTSIGGSSTGWGSSSSSDGLADTGLGLEPSALGQACAESDGCSELGAGLECCESKQCLGTCMVPCESVDDCPFAGMGCEHNYCLFPCEDNDDECSDWPGFTCQHGGTFCEND